MSEKTEPENTGPEKTESEKADTANAYENKLSPARRRTVNLLAVAGLLLSLAAGFFAGAPTLWGLLPIALYAVLSLLGMDILLATVAALLSGLFIAQQSPAEVGSLLGDSMADLITIIGMIIVLGAGVGEILRRTGVAETIVRGILRLVGETNRYAILLGVMLACLVLVASLGTLAGALAIAAPIIVPVTARAGYTRAATASMMFIGGCAGLTLAPFAGSNVAILKAADASYLTYFTHGAGPLAVLSLLLGLLIVPWMQRRTARQGDVYTAEEAAQTTESTVGPASRRATITFLVVLVASVIYAAVTDAGTSFPLLALPVLGAVTGAVGGLSGSQIISGMYTGASRLISMLLLFWLLAALFQVVDVLKPFNVILADFGPTLQHMSGLPFALAIALLGWVGIPGATAAQVVLIDKVFGQLAASLGVGVGPWVIVLLWGSKIDTYGPFPNANMIGVMGMARSTSLKNMLITGWLVLVPTCVMYTVFLTFLL